MKSRPEYCSRKDHLGVYRDILPVFDIDGDLYLDQGNPTVAFRLWGHEWGFRRSMSMSMSIVEPGFGAGNSERMDI